VGALRNYIVADTIGPPPALPRRATPFNTSP
jgi:hypothetical protein